MLLESWSTSNQKKLSGRNRFPTRWTFWNASSRGDNGKWADLLILDRDYFTIPEDDILKIRPLMTMVGGKMIVLNQTLASEWKVQPVGNQFNFEDKAIEWIGKPMTDEALGGRGAEEGTLGR